MTLAPSNGATVTDNVSTNLGYSLTVDGVALPQGTLDVNIDTSTTTTHSIIYTATDAAGNSASSMRVVIVE